VCFAPPLMPRRIARRSASHRKTQRVASQDASRRKTQRVATRRRRNTQAPQHAGAADLWSAAPACCRFVTAAGAESYQLSAPLPSVIVGEIFGFGSISLLS